MLLHKKFLFQVLLKSACSILILLILIMASVQYIFANGINSSLIVQNNNNGVLITDLKESAPLEYTVKSSDSVLSIAAIYLRDINKWPQLFGAGNSDNLPQIVVGNTLVLNKTDKYAKLMLKSKTLVNNNIQNIQKLMPQIRELPSQQTQNKLDLYQLRHLLDRPFVVESSIFANAPQLIAGPDEQLMYSIGDTVFASGFTGQVGDMVALFSPVANVLDPDTQADLGFTVRYNGVAVVDSIGEISALHIVQMYNSVSLGDKILPMVSTVNNDIALKRGGKPLNGKVAAIEGEGTMTVAGNTVAINLGTNQGVETGQVLRIYTNRRVDMANKDGKMVSVQLPPELIGEMVVYRVYSKLAFGVITDSIKPVYVGAIVKNN